MKTTIGRTRNKLLPQATFNTQQPLRRPWGGLTIAASLSVVAFATFAPAPAMAACVQAGNVVTCSGASSTGFGTGVETNLAVTVQSGASITVPSNVNAIDLANGNTATNNGAISVGDNALGMRGTDNNVFTNTGTIAVGSNSAAMFMQGSNNAVSNSGSISGTTNTGVGIDVLGANNTVTNSGSITMTGTGSTGIAGNGIGNTILNSGTITIGSATGTNGQGVFLMTSNTFTNSGTISAAGNSSVGLSIWDAGNIVTNSGTIVASGLNGIAVGIVGAGNALVNNGTIKGAGDNQVLFSFGTTGNIIVNNGTIDGTMLVMGNGNSLTNNGLVTISAATLLSPGDISFGGTFTQSAQGTLALRVDSAGNRDGLYASDAAQLGGTFRAVVQAGLYQITTTYTNVVQTTGAVTGQFSSVTSSSAFFTASATYNASTVDVTLTRQSFGAVAGETANQRAVGNALEAGYSPALTGTAAAFYSQLLAAGSVGVLDKLSGEGTSGTQNTAFAAGSLFGQTMDGQMNSWRAGGRGGPAGSGALGYAEARPVTSAFNALKAPPLVVQPQWHTWASGFGAGQSLTGDAGTGSAGFNDRIAGGAAGVDRLVNPDLLVGIAAGGSSATFNVDDRATSGRIDGAHVGAYAMQRLGATYVSAQLGYSHFNNSTTRTITGIGADEIAKGSFGSNQLGGRLEIGHTYDFNTVAVTPFAALQAARLWQAGYTESSVTGAGPGVLGLNYAARNVSSLPLFLGSKFDARYELGGGMMWMPFANVAWVHEFSPSRGVTAALVSLPVAGFTVEGARAASDAGRVELGSRLVLNSWSELSARFTGEFSNVGQSYAGTGSLRISW